MSCAGPTKCVKEQQLANAVKSQNGNGKAFIPSCNPAGGYERMQCDRSVGECWCVNKMGDEEPGTRVRGNKQYCDAPGRIFFCRTLSRSLVRSFFLSFIQSDGVLNVILLFNPSDSVTLSEGAAKGSGIHQPGYQWTF